jgi:hypothetical protein
LGQSAKRARAVALTNNWYYAPRSKLAPRFELR